MLMKLACKELIYLNIHMLVKHGCSDLIVATAVATIIVINNRRVNSNMLIVMYLIHFEDYQIQGTPMTIDTMDTVAVSME